MHLDEIVDWIDRAFGEELQDAQSEAVEDALRTSMGDLAYQRYFRDQVNRQIIRDYLTNAVVLGIITEGGLAAFGAPISTEEGRATLALYMLMSAVEDARDLPPVEGELEPLQPLQPAPQSQAQPQRQPRSIAPSLV